MDNAERVHIVDPGEHYDALARADRAEAVMREVAEELRESLSIGLIPTAEGIRLIADRLEQGATQ